MKSKPRKLWSIARGWRAECVLAPESGERIVDLSADLYDDKTSAKELRALAKWLVKAAAWLEDQK
jgi:hypothetical protein